MNENVTSHLTLHHKILEFYRRCLRYPVAILIAMGVLIVWALLQLPAFRFDASSDTLVAQNDPELAYFEHMSRTFGELPFLFLTYEPINGEIFSAESIGELDALTAALKELPGVAKVTSILDAPLLNSPPIALSDLAKGKFNTLQSNDIDKAQAKKELTQSPLFSDLLISSSGSTAAIRVDLLTSEKLSEAQYEWNQSAAQWTNVKRAEKAGKIVELKDFAALTEAQTIESVRHIRDRFADRGTLYLGGVPMIRADMVSFVQKDMAVFGGIILVLLAATLYFFFKRVRWVLIPLVTTSVTVLLTVGVLSALGQPATAISSSFISLLAIVSISFAIHLITRYRELCSAGDTRSQSELAYETMRSKLAPCLYTALTTMVAFASLLTSSITPVISFGWIMCLGIAISLLVTYSFFAAILVLLPKNEALTGRLQPPLLVMFFFHQVSRFPGYIAAASLFLLGVAFLGVNQLDLGNRVVEYFRADTEIREGLNFIDRNLGGTIPVDIILKFDPYVGFEDEADDYDDDEFDFGESEETYPERFWFTPEKVAKIELLQSYIDSRSEIGKSVSIANLEKVGRTFNDGEPLTYFQLSMILGGIPADIRESLIEPYADPASGLVRISTRLHETGPDYDLDQLIGDIEEHAVAKVGIAPDNIRVTGIGVLFNGMLAQLVDSQLSTIFFVVGATTLMFALLLKSIVYALVGVLPNLLSATTILALMGFSGISLDMMTITIAAIVIGIGVDDAIHYLHRYRLERTSGSTPIDAIKNSHMSIGRALYFTSMTIIVGLSALWFSTFVPTIYFGMLAAIAMAFALVANLAILPSLLLLAERFRGVR